MLFTVTNSTGEKTIFNSNNIAKIEEKGERTYILVSSGIGGFYQESFEEIQEQLKESRYTKARIPETDIEVEYDKETGELSYHLPLHQWEQCRYHEYSDS